MAYPGIHIPPSLEVGVGEEVTWEVIPYIDFSKGLDVVTSLDNLDPRALRKAKNIILEPRGGFRKRDGMTKVNVTAYDTNPIKRIFDFQRWNGNIFRVNASGTTLRLEDGTVLISTLANANLSFTVMSDKLLFVNGDNFYESDGTAAGTKEVPLPADTDATLTEVKRCTGLTVYLDRLWAYGDPQSPHSLYYSQTGRYDYFKSADMQINLLAGNADRIVRAEPFLGGMAVFRQCTSYSPGSVWAIFGDPVLDSRRIFRVLVDESTVSGRAVAQVGSVLIYPGMTNVYGLVSLDRDNPSAVRIGDGIATFIRNAYAKENMVAIGHDGKYYLAFQQYEASGCNDSVLVFDTRTQAGEGNLGAWVLWEGWHVNDWLVRNGVLHYADAKNGFVRKVVEGGYDDDGANIEMEVETGLLQLVGGGRRQFIHGIILRAPQPTVGSNVHVKAKVEYKTKEWDISLNESFVWGVTDWNAKWGWTDLLRKLLRMDIIGDRLIVNFTNNSTEPCHIYGFNVVVQPMMPWATQSGVTKT